MAKSYKVNFQPATGAEAMYELKNVLTGSGWTVVSSSDASTLSAGDAVTSTSLANTKAWFLIQEPTGIGGRQWCFQRTTTNNTSWRVKISPAAGFSGGSPTATQVPAATDEGVIIGTGNDATPTGVQLFPTDNTYKFHIIADNTAIGPAGNQSYGFWAFSNIAGGSALADLETLIMQEPLAVGTYPALVGTRAATTSGDADPAVYACIWASDGSVFDMLNKLGGASTEAQTTMRYFSGYQNNSGSFVVGDCADGFGQPAYLSTTPTSAEDVVLPFNVGRQGTGANVNIFRVRTTSIGWKGSTHYLRKRFTNRSASNTINLTTNAYVYVYDLLIPWPENVTPIF